MGERAVELSFDGAEDSVIAPLPSNQQVERGHFTAGPNPYIAHGAEDDEEASIGEESVDDPAPQPLPQADEHGNMVDFPEEETKTKAKGHEEDEEDSQGAYAKELGNEKEVKDPPRSVLSAGTESIKYLYSLGLLIFSVIVVMAAIFDGQTLAEENNIPSALAFIIFWFLIVWLAMMEGGQGCLVGLQPIDKVLYAESHPKTLKNTTLAHKGDNMERFIVGRQFLVVLVIFLINMMGGAKKGASVLGMGDVGNEIFLSSGIAMMLTTIILGQLTSQVNAALCMLDFINNYFMLFTSYVSLFIEFSGLLHSVYLVQIFFSKITGKPIESNEPPRTAFQNIFFWGRVLLSVIILGFAFAVTLGALFDGKTTMWDGVPSAVSVVIFFLLLAFVGMMEGMQIAAFALVNLPDEELRNHTIVYANCQLMFSGQNLQAFLIGRQICVACCMFIVARISTLDADKYEEENIFGVSDGLQEFFNTGLLGAVVLTIIGSLAWRIIASSFPMAFMSNPLIYIIIRLCLFLEKSGVCSAAWVLARWHKPLAGYQPDEVYLEGAERHTSAPVTRRDNDIDRFVAVVKYTYSLALLVFCVVVVMAAIFKGQTDSKDNGIPEIVAFLFFWFLILWLAMMEGGQGCLVGLQSIEKDKYAETHPKTLKNTLLAHKGDNMERFIVGRQFLVVLVIFLVSMMGAAIGDDVDVLGLPDVMVEIFVKSGIAMMITTIVLGQLTSQVNAAVCMLDFINNYFMLYAISYVSFFIEFSGLLHSVYLVQIFFSKITGKPIDSKEPPRSGAQKIFFWGRVTLSLFILAFALAVTLKALFDGNTTMWDGVPPVVSVIFFFLLLAFVGMMEGMQIAAFALVNMPEEELSHHPIAHANCQLMFSGQNLQAFLIGRQICVACCMFVVARISALDADYYDENDNIFGVPDGLQSFFNTGLLGAVVLTIIGSLAWRIIASSFPLAFMSNPLIYVTIRLCLLLEASGVCSASWVLARYHRTLVGYQPDEVYLEGAERQTSAPVTRRDKDIDVTVTVIKYAYSLGLLVFSVIVVMAAIFDEQTSLSQDGHPAAAFILFWLLIVWLAMMEGGQGCLVGLQPVDKRLYADSHTVTLKNTELAHKGDNMERFIVGRQFLVVLVIFLINLCGAAVPDAKVLNMNDVLTEIFLASGIAMMLTTIIIGQLTAQVNAAVCMLDFINTYFMLFTSYVSFFIEFSGLLHSVYLVQILFSKITGKPIETKEPPRSVWQNIFFWGRVIVSLIILVYALAVTLGALFNGSTMMWDGVPPAASVIIFFLLLCFVGMMEGMQIAAFALLHLPDEELRHHKIAFANCQLMFSGTNLQAFLIGRQICVACCMFVVARVSTLDADYYDENKNIFGISDGLQNFFNTGLLGAVVLTIIGSLAWRIVASSFPVAFMSNPLIYVTIRLCLLLEASGICSAAWLLALMHKQIAGFQPDEVYLGTKGDWAATDTSIGKTTAADREEPEIEEDRSFSA